LKSAFTIIDIYFAFDKPIYLIKMADIIQWDKVMGKKVSSIDGEDLGKVENVNTDSIEIKDGLIAMNRLNAKVFIT